MIKMPISPFLLKSIVPPAYLLQATLFFALIVVGLLAFIAFFLYRHHSRQLRKKQLRSLFSDLIAETIVAETEEEKRLTLDLFLKANTLLLQKPFARKILIRELVKTKDSLSGSGAENLRWLYETLELDRDTLKWFSSARWHRKASAIQQFAEMQQSRYLVKIYRETNNKNLLIRTEAQIAVVKLTGFKGLRFLNIVSHPVTQWQQLALISQLQEGEMEEAKIASWLISKNETVVQFALRLCQVYKCFGLHDKVLEALRHASETVRLQALLALKEMAGESTITALIGHFIIATKQEQISILDILADTGVGTGELSFLTSLLEHPDEAVRFRVMQLMQEVSPALSKVVMSQVKSDPAFTYLLPSLQKEAV